MFKNASLARVMGPLPSSDALTVAAARAVFAPTASTQAMSIGFVPPRAEHGALVEAVAGQLILAVQIETRTVPAPVVDKHMRAWCERIEQETGRKPGKKQRRDLKEQAVQELMPHAFPKTSRTLVWIDPITGLLVVDSSSTGKTDAVLGLIAQALEITLAPVNLQIAPAAMMATWLGSQQGLGQFDIGNECELQALDGEKTTVRYTRANLDSDDVRGHLGSGKAVKMLGLEWKGRVSFTLTDQMVLRKIALTDIVTNSAPDGDGFDADVAIFTGTMREVLSDLIVALGGEVQP